MFFNKVQGLHLLYNTSTHTYGKICWHCPPNEDIDFDFMHQLYIKTYLDLVKHMHNVYRISPPPPPQKKKKKKKTYSRTFIINNIHICFRIVKV